MISDLQVPYHHKKALEFCKYLKRHFKIEDDNVYNSGDECDLAHGSMYPKNPNGDDTPLQELSQSVDELKKWYDAFPKMKLCTSNHGTRWLRKATAAEIPSVMLRKYEEVLEAPDLWIWQKHWFVNSKHPFMISHGDDWSGSHPHVKAAEANNISTVIGHHHSKAGVQHIRTIEHHNAGYGYRLWAVVGGCLIDWDRYVFDYSRAHRNKPLLGCSVILDNGRLPMWIPID